ncbi:MAG: hypothetical protein EBQ89_03910 [Alphaproteobacteria bacterium]|nr:hypothetical protein [Alphaproteobacteria bacterium]
MLPLMNNLTIHAGTLNKLIATGQAAARVTVMGSVLLLTACADTVWPEWISGEPPRNVTGAQANTPGITRMGAEGNDWPRLQEVPNTPPAIQNSSKNILELEMQRRNGVAQHQKIWAKEVP